MFADSKLAARIDRAEARMCAGFAEAMHAKDPTSKAIVLPVAGGQAIFAAPRSPLNKVIGLCIGQTLDDSELERVEEEWKERNEPVRVEISALAVPEAVVMLSERGYRLHGFENESGKLIGRPTVGGTIFADGITVSKVSGEEEEKAWIDVVVTAFCHMDGSGSVADDIPPRQILEDIFRDFAVIPRLCRYLARLHGKPVGAASMRIDEGLAQISGAGTLPEARGRGVQKALLQQRLNDAVAAGCDLAVVTTAPGSRSQENVMRRGFELLYTRAVMIKSWETA